MKIQNVKGGYDFLPNEEKIRNYIKDTLKETFEEYGYNPIETPILCYYDILSDKYDKNSDILKEIYKLKDQGERKLGLRYDLTVPFAKFIALNKNNISFPFKRYEIAKVFRDGPVKTGRDREFTQCDIDVVGDDSRYIEIELLTLCINAFKKLNIDIIIKYNSRNLMNGIIINSGIDPNLIGEVTAIIDKKDKIIKEEFDNYLLDLGIETNKIKNLYNYFSMSLDEIIEKFKESDNNYIIEGLKEIKELRNYIKELNIEDICIFDPTLVRGQNYYTGNVFEIYAKNEKIKSSIAGGGRYDNMITNFIDDGNEYPAVGIGFGLSPIYEILKTREDLNKKSNLDIYIIPLNTKIECLKIANELRNYGYKVDIETKKRKMKKSLDYANKENIPYVIIVGEDEINTNIIKVKDMFKNKEIKINLNNLETIKNYIS